VVIPQRIFLKESKVSPSSPLVIEHSVTDPWSSMIVNAISVADTPSAAALGQPRSDSLSTESRVNNSTRQSFERPVFS
jgi:hypothetical protein